MDWRSLMLLALFAWAWEARAQPADPVSSVMWDYHHQRLLDGAPFVFDDRVRVEVDRALAGLDRVDHDPTG